MIHSRKYIWVFLITLAIFGTAFYISDVLNQRKIDALRAIQDKISIDILSSETQFSLLEESSCSDLGGQTALSQELGNLASKLSQTESDRGATDSEVQTLKRYYSLLEIKDYLLMQKVSEKCHQKPLSIIYFYSNAGDCSNCEKEGYVLTNLRESYPALRVYSFDYNLDISALRTLIAMNHIKGKLPALYINGTTYYGFQSIDQIGKILPDLAKMKVASSTPAK